MRCVEGDKRDRGRYTCLCTSNCTCNEFQHACSNRAIMPFASRPFTCLPSFALGLYRSLSGLVLFQLELLSVITIASLVVIAPVMIVEHFSGVCRDLRPSSSLSILLSILHSFLPCSRSFNPLSFSPSSLYLAFPFPFLPAPLRPFFSHLGLCPFFQGQPT